MKRKRLVVFSGAGMSAESGVNTFRDSNGLWEKYSIEEVATPEAWKRNPELVQRFYNERRKQILSVKPNQAHLTIASFQEEYDVFVITQNIDDLHERAGSKHVLHLHGLITLAKSSGPDAEKQYYPVDDWEMKMDNLCVDGYPLRPHVVWFGEEVPALDEAAQIIHSADLFVVIGTSLQVYPAAGLIYSVRDKTPCYIIDPKASTMQIPTNFRIIDKNASEGMKILKKILLESH